ncbi:WbqC family protein [Sulfurimonas sp. HSL3-7]|uniref:WbqC family protein n=1 Tax=Sulfonitrofixus jiaomeiensis TaxID=3131938 RepID=UPI0031F90555
MSKPMVTAIMQPYLFSYIGYWQLIKSVDTFVILDDVHYKKKGYINRNSILIDGKAHKITLHLKALSQNKLINEIDIGNNSVNILKSIAIVYKRAPYFQDIFPLIKSILEFSEKNLAKFIGNSLEEISNYLELNTKFIYSSAIEKDNSLRGQDKIINICEILNAKVYINLIGGQALYSKAKFKEYDIKLHFIENEIVEYRQFQNEFVPYLSIIDIMMFNSKDEVREMLNRYRLI